MNRIFSVWISALAALLLIVQDAIAEGNADRGRQEFRQCVACHSVTPGEHLTGPSLAGVVGRKAGRVEDFGRYSDALKKSDITWTEANLEKWLMEPGKLIPGTSMQIRGVADPLARQDIVAFLKTTVVASASTDSEPGSDTGMMGETGGSRLVDLRNRTPSQEVVAIRYCGDAYHVTLGTSNSYTFWEFNLRFKTDSSASGPPKGKPAILRGGMMGDRAFVIFSDPKEISAFIDTRC